MTPTLTLRDTTEADLPVLYEHQIDPEAVRMADFPSRDRPAFMAHWARILADDGTIKKTIVCDGEPIGHLVAFERAGEYEVGYWIGKEHWGQGIATRALVDFLPLVARRPLHAHIARHNVASRRVLEKVGFDFEREQSDGLVFRLD